MYWNSGSGYEREMGNLASASLLPNPTLSFSAAIKAAGLTVSMKDVDKGVQEEERKKEENMNREPIYHGSSISLGTAMLLLATFTQTYNISNEAFDMFLAILSVILPAGNLVPPTYARYKKYFTLNSNAVCHYFCTFCLRDLENRESICKNSDCHITKDRDPLSYFVEIPIQTQLEEFFNRPGFHDMLKHGFSDEFKDPNIIKDIYNGELYQKQVKNGFLSDINNVSFIMNTNGEIIQVLECVNLAHISHGK